MKKYLISLLLMGVSVSVFAQLEVNSDGKVKIASNLNYSNYNLLIGNNSFGLDTACVGISASTTVMDYKRNMGVIGTINANSNLTYETNIGVFGVVSPINNTHGRNYGLCGMIGYSGDHYGGAGVYGASYTVYYAHPTNIQGTYAGYFQGDVKVTGNLTIPNMFIPSDSRLNENIVSLNDRGQQTNTLDNLLSMSVIEYNTKSRIKDEFPDGIGRDATEEEREAYEYLKRDEIKMSSRRHYGIDAEELQKVYPDLVLEGQDGYLSVNYVELVPILIRSIQELKQELDEVKGEAKTMTRSASDGTADFNAAAKNNVLYQNTPNPFKEQTIIRFSLEENVRDASICIFDMTGKTLKKLPIDSGMESVSIGGYELGEGMFLYSLIVSGQVIDTKRMVISK